MTINDEAYKKLMEARCRCMVREPFYGHFAMQMEWCASEMSWCEKEENKRVTIRIIDSGRIEVLFYAPYIASKSLKQLTGVIKHIIEHIMRLHPVRRLNRDPSYWDRATDMIVNGKRTQPRIGYVEKSDAIVLPGDNMVWCPEDWDMNETAEATYAKLIKDQKIDEETKKTEGIDDHGGWNQSTVSEDEARQVIYEITNQSASNSRGNIPGHVQEILKDLAKPAVRWRELLRRYMGRHIGNHRRTYSRTNRRHDRFGIPGWSHHAAAVVTVVMDTSGSVSTKLLEQFFAEIDMISCRAKVFLLQWDASFQDYSPYRRGNWKNFQVRGRGGTDMAAAVKYLEDNHIIGDVMIMVTDGYTPWPPKRNYPAIFVMAREGQNSSCTEGPDWGHIVKINL